MSWQLLGGFAFSCVAIPVYVSLMPPEPFIPTWPDTLYLPIFAIFCTLFMYILQIQSLEHISAFTVNLSYNLEPIYSIILAMIIFGEARDLCPSFYAGIGLIALSVVLQTSSVVRGRKRQKRIEILNYQRSHRRSGTDQGFRKDSMFFHRIAIGIKTFFCCGNAGNPGDESDFRMSFLYKVFHSIGHGLIVCGDHGIIGSA